MANEIPLPLKGFSEGVEISKTPAEYSPYMNNVHPFDTLDGRLRLGQRPGLDKAYSQQIAGESGPVVAICSVSVVESP
jgi:hypothetical protein